MTHVVVTAAAWAASDRCKTAMKIQRAYKTKLVLNNKERTYFNGCAGFARVVYNWALQDRVNMYDDYLILSKYTDDAHCIKAMKKALGCNKFEQKKYFNSVKDEILPWNREYPYKIMESVFDDVDTAYKNFFSGRAGFPKRKGKAAANAFKLRSIGAIEPTRINLLNKIGWVRLKEHGYIPSDAKVNSVTLSEHGDDWYIAVQCEVEIDDPVTPTGNPIGVDLGVKSLAVVSDGAVFDAPKSLRKHESKLAQLQRKMARQVKFSSNWYKTKAKVSKLHRRIANIRKHHQHEVSSYVSRKAAASAVVIEDLNVSGMMARAKPIERENGDGYEKNNAAAKSGLSKSIADAGIGEIRRQIEYKAEWNGVTVVKANRFYPSSQICNHCQHQNTELKLTDRQWSCPNCGKTIDRDMNAAINLAALA